MDNKVLSVIIPAYNAEKTVERAVKSALSIKDKEIEIIVINDGSTDHTEDICNKLCELDTRVNLINKENEGVSAARNDGVEKAKGDYILFLDADDELISEAYKKVFDRHIEYEEDIIIFPYMVEKKGQAGVRMVDPFIEGNITKDDFYTCVIQSTFMNFCWGKLYRKDFVKKSNIKFNVKLKMGEDLRFQLELMKYSPKMRYYKEPLVLYYQPETSVTHRYTFDRFDDLIIDYHLRVNLSSQLTTRKVDIKMMYFDLGRNLLSYIKYMSKHGKYKETKRIIKSYLEMEELKDIITQFPLGQAGLKMDMIAFMLKKNMIAVSVFILRII